MRWIVVVLLFATACNKKVDQGPACPQITDHMLELTKQRYGGHGSMELGNRKQMIDECVRRDYSRDMRLCLFGARNLADLAACQNPAPVRAPGSGAPR